MNLPQFTHRLRQSAWHLYMSSSEPARRDHYGEIYSLVAEAQDSWVCETCGDDVHYCPRLFPFYDSSYEPEHLARPGRPAFEVVADFEVAR